MTTRLNHPDKPKIVAEVLNAISVLLAASDKDYRRMSTRLSCPPLE